MLIFTKSKNFSKFAKKKKKEFSMLAKSNK